MSEVSCLNCIFSDTVAKLGDVYTYLDPYGHEKTKTRDEDVVICRALPPMNGWPLVSEDDWCGNFNPGEVSE